MKRVFFVIILFTALISGCSGYREVIINIPQHPWESQEAVWYVLRSSDSDSKLFVNHGTTSVAYPVPAGRTVAFALYPYGEYAPLGGEWQESDGVYVSLSFDKGPLAELFIRAEKEKEGCTSRLDFRTVYSNIVRKCGDGFSFKRTELLLDIINGEVKASSVKKLRKCTVDEFYLPGGTWIPESRTLDIYPSGEGTLLPKRSFAPGCWCWRNSESRYEYRVVVDEDCEGYIQRIKRY